MARRHAAMEKTTSTHHDSSFLAQSETYVPELLELADTMCERLVAKMRRYTDLRFKAISSLGFSVASSYTAIAFGALYYLAHRSEIADVSISSILIAVLFVGISTSALLLLSSYRFVHVTRYERRAAENVAQNLKYVVDTLHNIEERNHLDELQAYRVRVTISDLELALSEFQRQVPNRFRHTKD